MKPWRHGLMREKKSRFIFRRAPLLLGVGPDFNGPILCGYDPSNSTQINTTLKPNEEKVFRISFSGGGTIHLSREKVPQ